MPPCNGVCAKPLPDWHRLTVKTAESDPLANRFPLSETFSTPEKSASLRRTLFCRLQVQCVSLDLHSLALSVFALLVSASPSLSPLLSVTLSPLLVASSIHASSCL